MAARKKTSKVEPTVRKAKAKAAKPVKKKVK